VRKGYDGDARRLSFSRNITSATGLTVPKTKIGEGSSQCSSVSAGLQSQTSQEREPTSVADAHTQTEPTCIVDALTHMKMNSKGDMKHAGEEVNSASFVVGIPADAKELTDKKDRSD
jgi:hypothetical protein